MSSAERQIEEIGERWSREGREVEEGRKRGERWRREGREQRGGGGKERRKRGER